MQTGQEMAVRCVADVDACCLDGTLNLGVSTIRVSSPGQRDDRRQSNGGRMQSRRVHPRVTSLPSDSSIVLSRAEPAADWVTARALAAHNRQVT